MEAQCYLAVSVINAQFQRRVTLLNHRASSPFRIAESIRGELLDDSAFTDDGIAIVVPETQIVVETDGFEHRINTRVSLWSIFPEPGGVPMELGVVRVWVLPKCDIQVASGEWKRS